MISAAATRSSPARPLLAGPKGLPRVLEGVGEDGLAESLRSHVRRYGTVLECESAGLIPLVEASGLKGRGGGSFPTGAKLRAVANGRGRPVVLVNGVEGEPVSGKDRALLRAVPHLVLDGAVLAAAALGANDVYVAVADAAAREQVALSEAITERTRGRVDPSVSIRVATVRGGFVAGEETALVQFLNRGVAKPTFTPPRPFERGIAGAPTLVLNAETFAHLAMIARFGSDWFRELGTSSEPGSTLVTIRGAVRRPGVHEVPLGTPFRKVVENAGGLVGQAGAFLVGGYFGTWLPAQTALECRLLDADLQPHGAALGAGAIVALPRDLCALGEVARIARYLSNESAGQCGPCIHGLDAIATGLERIVAGTGDERGRLSRWVEVVRGRGACRHPDGATRFVSSALSVFADEVHVHLREGRCRGQDRHILPVPQAPDRG